MFDSTEKALSKDFRIGPSHDVRSEYQNAWTKAVPIAIVKSDFTRKPKAVPAAVFICCREILAPAISYNPVGAGVPARLA